MGRGWGLGVFLEGLWKGDVTSARGHGGGERCFALGRAGCGFGHGHDCREVQHATGRSSYSTGKE